MTRKFKTTDYEATLDSYWISSDNFSTALPELQPNNTLQPLAMLIESAQPLASSKKLLARFLGRMRSHNGKISPLPL